MDRCLVFAVPDLAGQALIPPKGGTTNGLRTTMKFPLTLRVSMRWQFHLPLLFSYAALRSGCVE